MTVNPSRKYVDLYDYESLEAEVKELREAIVNALRLMQADPHMWSTRPCATCKEITALVGKNYGCYTIQERQPNPTPKAESRG